MSENDFLEMARNNQKKAFDIIRKLKIYENWEVIGAKVNLIGSLKTGVLMKHLDIDFHVYTTDLKIEDSFKAIGGIACNKGVMKVIYMNLLDHKDACLEWHMFYQDDDGREWQIDMIHIVKGSYYDGYFEKVADRINQCATDGQKERILRLKYETPETFQIPGIEYCQAVLQEDVKSFNELLEWRKNKPVKDIIEWLPE